MQFAANEEWFTIDINGSPEFAVYAFNGSEGVSRPFDFHLELVHASPNVDIVGLLTSEALLRIKDRSYSERLVHGVVRQMRQLHTSRKYTHYSCNITSRFWFLSLNNEHRIFQNKSVIEIIEQILKEQAFTGDSYAFKCFYSYKPREYCVQYGESDFDFISRLCEEEGIYYYFEHSESAHCMCFSDREGGPPIPGESNLRFFAGSGQTADTAVIREIQLQHNVNSDASAYRDWNFSRPKLNLAVDEKETDPAKAPVPAGMNLEVYQYPHYYQEQGDGKRNVKLQLDRQLSLNRQISGNSDVSRLTPGYTVTINRHPRGDINAGWWLLEVQHAGQQPQVLQQDAPDRGMRYLSSFTAIPEETRFVPRYNHPKKRIVGQQTAIVTGSPGEEIYPDAHGRVKVQFFWDREGEWNEKTTCWIRAAQGWAGGQYGSLSIPRVGHEVIVSFLDGDPDRPIITGRVHHELNKPAYELPANKTRTVFKSLSSPGGAGFNELRVEDKAGQEELYLRAEKDVNVFVKNEWSDQICSNSHHLTGGDTFTRTVGETHRVLHKNRVTGLGETDYTMVDKDSILLVNDRHIAGSKNETQIFSQGVIMVSAEKGISLCCGNSVITLKPDDITIDSPNIWLNCAKEEPVKVTEFKPLEVKAPKGADFRRGHRGQNAMGVGPFIYG